MRNRSKKGFTLIELIIAITIIAILAAVLIPTWNFFIRQGKVTTQNNNAKVVFDAAQTECTKYKFRDRSLINEISLLNDNINSINKDTTLTSEEKNLKVKNVQKTIESKDAQKYVGPDFYFYWDGKKGFACDANLQTINKDAALDAAFAKAINNGIETPEEVVYKIHVKDYQVVSVACAKNEKDRLIGSYPTKQKDRNAKTFVNFSLNDAEL